MMENSIPLSKRRSRIIQVLQWSLDKSTPRCGDFPTGSTLRWLRRASPSKEMPQSCTVEWRVTTLCADSTQGMYKFNGLTDEALTCNRFFYKHELLANYEWYWRLEPEIKYFCDIT